MNKWYGTIGFAETRELEDNPGIYVEDIQEHEYFGDVIRNHRRLQDVGNINSDVTISNEISIVADPYANQNFHAMRYITFMGTKWIITAVDVEYPRLRLSIGGVYNENED